MKTYTIDTENAISAFATAEESAAATQTPFDSFSSRQDLADLLATWPAERLVAIWNSLPGVAPVKRFKTSNVAATRIWERIRGLGEAAQPEAASQGTHREDRAEGQGVRRAEDSPHREQERGSHCDVEAQGRRNAGRDHGAHGLAETYNARLGFRLSR
jgi:hypothetical protein